MFKFNSLFVLKVLFLSAIFLPMLTQAAYDKTRFVSLDGSEQSNLSVKKQTDQACIDNFSGDFECKNIDLLAHIPLSGFSSSPSAASDVWGYTDLNNGAEYALIGLDNGVAVVNVSDPTNPSEVGTILGKIDVWRDIKVYQYFDESLNLWRAYAYATIDGSSDNLTIINLNIMLT